MQVQAIEIEKIRMEESKRISSRLNHYHGIIPLSQRPLLLRLDTLPFLILYSILILVDHGIIVGNNATATATGNVTVTRNLNIQTLAHLILFPCVLMTHVGLFLAAQWRVKVEARVGYRRVTMKDSHQWTHCLVIPPGSQSFSAGSTTTATATTNTNANATCGRTEIVPVQMTTRKNVTNNRTGNVKGNINSDDVMSNGYNTDEKVAVISYEETVFRCCLNHDLPGQDVDMDSIWKLHDKKDTSSHSHDKSKSSKVASTPISIDRTETSSSNNVTTTVSASLSTNASSAFHRLHYPTDLPLSFYTLWTGHTTLQSLQQTLNIYSNNSLIINLPPFIDLLRQQLLAPFFLFQLLCVLLWCLDEYWYYAIFTLFTLIMFECTVAHSRMKNLQRLRGTLRPPLAVWVWRQNLWNQIGSHDLIVGDVISLSSRSRQNPGYANASASANANAHHHEGGTYVPCDLLLLQGNAVLNEATLTGESVPQLKESIDVVASAFENEEAQAEAILDMEDASYKRAILFGGTVLVNHSNDVSLEEEDGEEKDVSTLAIPVSPDDGCLAFVLRTGFDTQQGSLLRTMVHTSTKSQSDGVNTKDTFLFIMILLFCAVLSSAFVLHHAWDDPNRNRFKLILHVIIIITSVVPPELPMELSLAVTASLSDLVRRCSVYCTEPFRIPLAGMVDTCCFDKTGTLTSDEMVLKGVRLPVQDTTGNKVEMSEDLLQPLLVLDDGDEKRNVSSTIPNHVLRVMVGCQSLTPAPRISNSRSSDGLIGDPLEKAVLEGCGWQLLSNDTIAPPDPSNKAEWIKVLHRFAFTSKLKRMTAIAQNLGSDSLWALSKGAPETLKDFLNPATIPDSYDAVSRYHMSKGQRVLAMGYRKLGSKDSALAWKKRGRAAVESGLVFAGFIVLDCPLKPDSKKVIKELRNSGHHTVMITGDAVLTAAEVARQVGIVKTKGGLETFELRELKDDQSKQVVGSGRFAFVPVKSTETANLDTKKCIAYSSANLDVVKGMLASSNIAAICVTGDTLTKIATDAVRRKMRQDSGGISNTFIDPKTVLLHPDAQSTLQTLVPLISVFARHAPRQKEAVVAAFNGAGRITLMCGDGTNDVGALKISHCGISIISVPDLEAKQRDAIDGLTKAQEGLTKKKKKSKKKAKSWEEHMQALAEAEEELNNVALGDASVASPFTSRATSIRCTTDVLQRGRCTLVTMTQIYKILGVNCLVNALVLSSLHLVGAKQGDSQLTIVGVIVAGLFFFVTKGEPLSKLSPHRPPSSVLSKQILTSIAMQFAIHCVCIMGITAVSKFYLDPYDPSLVPDGVFNPNTLNSATFIMTVLTTVNTFVVNYRGRPFMQDLRENKMMMKGLQICYVALFSCALEVFPPLNDLMQLAPLPGDGDELVGIINLNGIGPHLQFLMMIVNAIGFKMTLCALMAIDTALSYVAEKALIKFFEPDVK